MNRQAFRKQAYICPAIEVIETSFESELMDTSFPNNGGHKKAGDDNSDINDAKQGFFDEEEEEEAIVPTWGI